MSPNPAHPGDKAGAAKEVGLGQDAPLHPEPSAGAACGGYAPCVPKALPGPLGRNGGRRKALEKMC